MKETAERIVKVGFRRDPKAVFDEVERVTARMARDGWTLRETVVEEGLGGVHLLFERDIADLDL